VKLEVEPPAGAPADARRPAPGGRGGFVGMDDGAIKTR
jgi:hypothetical protein